MSTRSNIAIELPDENPVVNSKGGKIKSIYVHCDGYPYGIGKILIRVIIPMTKQENYLILVMHLI